MFNVYGLIMSVAYNFMIYLSAMFWYVQEQIRKAEEYVLKEQVNFDIFFYSCRVFY